MDTKQTENDSLKEIYKKISAVVPEIEWKVHAPLIKKINKLKKEKNAVILYLICKPDVLWHHQLQEKMSEC